MVFIDNTSFPSTSSVERETSVLIASELLYIYITLSSAYSLPQPLLQLRSQNAMHMARHMSRIKPKIRVQWRRTPISLIVSLNIRLIIPSTEIRRINNSISSRIIQNPTQSRMRIEQPYLDITPPLSKNIRLLRQRSIIPRHLRGIRVRCTRRLITRCTVQRGQVQEQEGSVAEGVEVVDGAEKRPCEVCVEGWEIYGVFGAVSDVVYADPDCD